MRAFVRALSILIVGQIVAALEEPAGLGYVYNYFDKEKSLLREGKNENYDYNQIYQLSVDGPTRFYFTQLAKSAEWDLQANIERIKPDGKGFNKCSFAIKNEKDASLYYKLRGQINQIEILEIFRSYPGESQRNQLDIYVVNMNDCSIRRNQAFEGYDYPAKRLYVINRYWDTDRIDYFAIGMEKSVGSYMSRLTYYITNNSFVGPMKFTMLDDKKDYRINFLVPVEGEDTYMAGISTDEFYQDIKVDSYGKMIKSETPEKLRKAYYLRYSVYRGYLGLCFREEINKKSVLRCLQYDKDLNKKLDRTFDLPYDSSLYSVRNNADGGLYLLSFKCAQKDEYSCEQAEMRLNSIPLGGKSIEETKIIKEDYCAISTRSRFGFIDDGDKKSNCMYYSCYYKSKDVNEFENSVRVKCL
ncbi:hypothetical protein QAD02_006577 [Eretmocerus hayati]|uniref:Uncharacterized protein n=1 Tax=Eretmocerus hayati TaxID=131215 RepID=A0ACC2N189_9HYME|nr:hypothetical protein QAD02_006577 [Eretmocerus hayati]